MKKQRRLYIGNLPWATTSEGLREHFAVFGKIVDVVIPEDKESGRIKGFGFVEFADGEDAVVAIEKSNGEEFLGRPLKVDFATDRGARREAEY